MISARPARAAQTETGALEFRQPGAGAVSRNIQDKLGDIISARDHGARFDGVADDRAALQAAIDAAHSQRKPLLLPGGTARLGGPLDFRRRYVNMVGAGMGETILKAGAAMDKMIDVEDASDVIISPVTIADLTLDGDNRTTRNLAIRLRHHSVFRNILSINSDTGFWERDCWLARRFNCRTNSNRIGWHLAGSNNSSHWDGCSFVGCSDRHLLIEANGTARDGNSALLFSACDVEFGEGIGIETAEGVNATFNTCYLGEQIEGDVLRNRGHVRISGGVLYFGHGERSFGVRPLKGKAIFEGTTINAQSAAFDRLVNLSPAEVAAGDHGRVRFADIDSHFPIGGNPVMPGDFLDYAQAQCLAPRLGRNWASISRGVEARDGQGRGGSANAHAIRCDAVTAGAPLMGLAGRLTSTEWRENEPLYIVIVYSSSKPLTLRLSGAMLGGSPSIEVGTLPAAPQITTYVKVDIDAPAGGYEYLEMTMTPVRGDTLTLHKVALADSSFVNRGAGVLGNLAML